jgi:hypothetical protein
MKIENIIRRVLREQEENLSELPPFDDFFDSDWNLALNFMNRYSNKKFYHLGDLDLRDSDIETLGNLVRVEGDLDLFDCKNLKSLGNLEYVGGLNLTFSDVKTLGNLVRVEGYLNLQSCENLASLGDLEYVGGWVDLRDTKIETLGNLNYVGGFLDLRYTKIKTLGNLNHVGGNLGLRYCKNLKSLGELNYVGNDLDLKSTPLSKKYTGKQIRKIVEVVGEVYL